jgi:hypothetical protein
MGPFTERRRGDASATLKVLFVYAEILLLFPRFPAKGMEKIKKRRENRIVRQKGQ